MAARAIKVIKKSDVKSPSRPAKSPTKSLQQSIEGWVAASRVNIEAGKAEEISAFFRINTPKPE